MITSCDQVLIVDMCSLGSP